MLTNVPLLIVPFIVYNIQIIFAAEGIGIWDRQVLELSMISGEKWVMSMGDLMICMGLFLLFFEIIKATRVGANTIIDHLLSTFVLIAFLVEFLLDEIDCPQAIIEMGIVTAECLVGGPQQRDQVGCRDNPDTTIGIDHRKR